MGDALTFAVCEEQRPDGIALPGDGRAIFSGRALALLEWFDAQFLVMARNCGAEEVRFPTLVPRALLERAGYFDAFPHGSTRAVAPGREETHVLAPAVCYQVYAQLAGQTLAVPRLITCAGRCYRHEHGAFDGLARLWEFTMREIVFLGSAGWVSTQRRAWTGRIRDFAARLSLAGRVEPASDPFFTGGAARGKKLLQQLKELKYELRLERLRGASLAAASFNLHEEFFGRRFGIRLPDGRPAATGCAALGLERWVCAFLAQRGAAAIDALLVGQASRPVPDPNAEASFNLPSTGGPQ